MELAARAAFDFGQELVLQLHPLRLPRTGGSEGGDSVPSAVARWLRDKGVVRGTCLPRRESARDTPRCADADAGYVLRLSEPLRAAGDTVQLYLQAERYASERGRKPEALRFEKTYQFVGRGSDWRVVREARVKE